ncbi:serine threonine kinase [Chlorella sorokiniana]|uniref:Serine threonine kinase n=1 Tax=Chlorella sorokiniana TaxID=3076 RepID=A0A2P6U1S3_CHLSO|nr:serine threonine kinase [Chlorella sorokiniana]|eukprot:PRW60254.1 serine threonine kinase [Chlorella sorokiniana]
MQPSVQLKGWNVDALSASSDGSLLIAGLSNFIGRHWTGAVAVISADAAANTLQLRELKELRAGVPAVALLPEMDQFTGRRVVASGDDSGSVDLWYLSGGSEGALLEHSQARVLHDAAVTALAPGPAGNALASASADGTLRLWETSSLLTCTAQLGSGGSGTALSAVAWAGHALVAAAGDAGISLWDVRQSGAAAPAAAAALGAWALSLAAHTNDSGQQLLVAGDALGQVSVFDARSLAQPLQQRALHGDAVHAVAAATAPSVNGSKHVATGSDDGSIQLLKVADLAGSCQLAPATKDGEAPCYVRALAWSGSEGEQRLFRGGWDQTVSLALH